MAFPRIDAQLRTDYSFRNKFDEDHLKETSPIEKLPINLIDTFPVSDALHLLDLGVMKKCLLAWVNGSFNFKTKFSGRDIIEISTFLQKCNETIPYEIHRKVRGIDLIHYWKGLEFRTFLLYIGPVVLKQHLNSEVYYHFLLFFCAVTICTNQIYHKYLHIARKLFDEYIERFIDIYGIESVSSNIHNLHHVVDDVILLGPLPKFSAYPFENTLYKIKRMLRSGNLPLAQVAKRIIEQENFERIDDDEKNKKMYPLLNNEKKLKRHDINGCEGVFESIQLAEAFLVKNDNKNKWFLTHNLQIVEMVNATYFNNKIYVYGKIVREKHNFFEVPIKSEHLNIFESCGDTGKAQLFEIANIKCKMVHIQFKDKSVFIPLNHTLTN